MLHELFHGFDAPMGSLVSEFPRDGSGSGHLRVHLAEVRKRMWTLTSNLRCAARSARFCPAKPMASTHGDSDGPSGNPGPFDLGDF